MRMIISSLKLVEYNNNNKPCAQTSNSTTQLLERSFNANNKRSVEWPRIFKLFTCGWGLLAAAAAAAAAVLDEFVQHNIIELNSPRVIDYLCQVK